MTKGFWKETRQSSELDDDSPLRPRCRQELKWCFQRPKRIVPPRFPSLFLLAGSNRLRFENAYWHCRQAFLLCFRGYGNRRPEFFAAALGESLPLCRLPLFHAGQKFVQLPPCVSTSFSPGTQTFAEIERFGVGGEGHRMRGRGFKDCPDRIVTARRLLPVLR